MEKFLKDIATKQAVCLIENKQTKRKLKRALKGTEIQWTESSEDIDASSIIFVDSKQHLKNIVSFDKAAQHSQFVILGESVADDEVIALMNKASLNHVISAGSDFDEAELLATSVKIASGDIFGLEKYLRWGATVHKRSVNNYGDKKLAINFVGTMAKKIGVRRLLLNRMENVTDELLMNAIYDAPQLAKGTNLPLGASIQVASDGCFFAIAVTDNFGLLDKKVILNHLTKARNSGGAPRTSGAPGAGLGLYFVITYCSRFIVNIEKEKRTEIICLFDMRLQPSDMPNCANSLHVFIKS